MLKQNNIDSSPFWIVLPEKNVNTSVTKMHLQRMNALMYKHIYAQMLEKVHDKDIPRTQIQMLEKST